jgi:hypothetical protein
MISRTDSTLPGAEEIPPEDLPEDWEECGCCGGYHPPDFDGDCRDDDNRRP